MTNETRLLALTCILASAFYPTRPPSQTNPPKQPGELFIGRLSEEHKRRLAVPLELGNLALAQAVFTDRLIQKYRDPEQGKAEAKRLESEMLMGSLELLNEVNAFWKDGKAQEQVLKDYLARVKLVTQASEEEWSEALLKVDPPRGVYSFLGKVGLTLPTLLGSVVIQDRLFAVDGFKQQESKRLLLRMKAIPQDAISKWADARQLQKYQAALSLVNDDSLFNREAFKEELFAKKLAAIQR